MDINITKLTVKYNHHIVGYLKLLEDSSIAFQYDDEWIKVGFSISPLSLPLSNKIYTSKSPYFNGLYGVFNDSLPDGWGELLVRRQLASKGINYDKLNALTKLTLVSGNGLGGLTYIPTQSDVSKDVLYDLDTLYKDIKRVLENEDGQEGLDLLYQLGGSSGGARPKAHILYEGEPWIVKFANSMDPKNEGELEFKANEFALKSGLNLSEFKLFPSTLCSGYFGTKRFDRNKNQRVHMISLSSLLETSHRIPNLDYGHLFSVIQKICVHQSDIYEAYKMMCFNVFYNNKDDHGRNFSFLYDELLHGYKLSPAYDLTKTPYKYEHEMTVLGNGRPEEKNLLDLAKEMKLSLAKCKQIIEKVKETLK